MSWSSFFPEAIRKLSAKKQLQSDRFMSAEDEAVQIAAVQEISKLRNDYDLEAATVLGPWAKYEQIFVPAGRAFISQLNATIFTRVFEGESIDPFMAAFGSLLERSRFVLQRQRLVASDEPSLFQEKYDFLTSVFRKIIGAELSAESNEEILRFDDGRCVKTALASYGHQEILPLLLVLADFFLWRNTRGRAVYIEEPEAHLFPVTQKQIVEFIAATFRELDGQMSLVLTTHSPYVLTSINNLLEAGKLYDGASPDAKKRLEKIVPSSQILKLDEVVFYALENGKAKSIIDSETELIDAAIIDSVSEDIATQFDDLLMEADEKR